MGGRVFIIHLFISLKFFQACESNTDFGWEGGFSLFYLLTLESSKALGEGLSPVGLVSLGGPSCPGMHGWRAMSTRCLRESPKLWEFEYTHILQGAGDLES